MRAQGGKRWRRLRRLLPLLLLAFLPHAAGCASTSGQGGGGADALTVSLGLASATGIEPATADLLSRFGYQIERYEHTRNEVYLETRWNERSPLEGEAEAGYATARTKLYIRGRPRGPNLSLRMRVENEVRRPAGDWEPLSPTSEFVEYARQIGDELKAEYDRGIRVY